MVPEFAAGTVTEPQECVGACLLHSRVWGDVPGHLWDRRVLVYSSMQTEAASTGKQLWQADRIILYLCSCCKIHWVPEAQRVEEQAC